MFADTVPFTPNMAAVPLELDDADTERDDADTEDIPSGQLDAAASLEEHGPAESTEAAVSQPHTGAADVELQSTVENTWVPPPSQLAPVMLPPPPVFRPATMQPTSSNWAAEPMQLTCMTCNTMVSPHNRGVKLKNKQRAEYICGKCNCVAAQMTYGLGSWPTEEFLGLEPETKLDFYKSDGNAAYKKRQYAMMCAKKKR